MGCVLPRDLGCVYCFTCICIYICIYPVDVAFPTAASFSMCGIASDWMQMPPSAFYIGAFLYGFLFYLIGKIFSKNSEKTHFVKYTRVFASVTGTIVGAFVSNIILSNRLYTVANNFSAEEYQTDYQVKFLLTGAVVGLVLGFLVSFVFARRKNP